MVGVITLSNALAALPHAGYEPNTQTYYGLAIRDALGTRAVCAVAIGDVSPLAARAHVERAIAAIEAELKR